MPLSNHKVTEEIEQLTKNFRSFLSSLNQQSKRSGHGNIDPRGIISQLLYNPAPHMPLSLEQINTNYRVIKGQLPGSYDLIVDRFADRGDAAKMAQIAKVQLEAIAAGFDAYVERENIERAQEAAQQRQQAARQPQVVQHIHYHRGYYRDPWMDFWFYQTIFGGHHHHHHHHYHGGSSQPTTGKTDKKDENEVSWAGILLAVALVGGAVATIGYSAMQTYYRIDEMLHGEDIAGNATKLTVTGLASFSGFMLGTLIGATYFANPILGAVCTSIIASAIGMKASKWGVELAHQASNTTSAVNYDPRFCLSANQAVLLHAKGYDIEAINEALREIAIMMKNQPANGLKFWHNPHGPLIDLMRALKSGYEYNVVNLNDKNFVIKQPTPQYYQDAIAAQTPAHQAPHNPAYQATEQQVDAPMQQQGLYPDLSGLYQPVAPVQPQTYGNYPTFDGTPPPSYEALYEIRPSAPPMYA